MEALERLRRQTGTGGYVSVSRSKPVTSPSLWSEPVPASLPPPSGLRGATGCPAVRGLQLTKTFPLSEIPARSPTTAQKPRSLLSLLSRAQCHPVTAMPYLMLRATQSQPSDSTVAPGDHEGTQGSPQPINGP